MAFSQKHRKRLKDTAVLVKNAKTMAVEMEEINSKYGFELQLVVERVRAIVTKSETLESSRRILDKRKIRPFRSILGRKKALAAFRKNLEENCQELPSMDNEAEIENKNIPDWAKDVWRKLMFHCHPDRISNKKLSNEEVNFRSDILMLAMKANETEDWPELLLLGILVDQYTEKLNHKKQVGHLNSLYSIAVEKINEIQNSSYWLWGNNWDSIEIRLKILTGLLQANNVPLLPVKDLIKIILDLEEE